MCIQNLVTFCQFLLKILRKNKILASIKSRNSVTNLRKMMHNNPNVDLVNIIGYTKYGQILSIFSEDIQKKEILALIKGNNSVINLQKMMPINPNRSQ